MAFLEILVLFLLPNSSYLSQDVEVVADIIRSIERPVYIIATVCWNTTKKAELVTALNNLESNILIGFNGDGAVNDYDDLDQRAVLLADANCPDAVQYLQKNNEVGNFQAPLNWIIFGLDNNTKAVKNYSDLTFQELNIFPDGNVIIVQEVEVNTYNLYRLYRRSKGSTWIKEALGMWPQDRQRFPDNFQRPLFFNRLNLNGTTITTSYVITNNDTINHLTDYYDDHIDTITKVQYILTSQLLEFMNATRESVFVDTWGYQINGTWNGMIGLMLKGMVELGGTAMFITKERIPVMDFIASPTPTKSKFVFRQPKLSYENNLFLLPFRNSVWICSAILCVILLGVMVLVATWEWKNRNQQRENKAGILRPNFSDSILFIFGAACQQGSPVELKGSLGRLVMFILFLAFMFLYTSYSANIVALLQSSASNIRTLEDMLNSRLKFGVDDVVFNHYYFSTATDPIRKAIYQKKVAPPGVKPQFMAMEDGIRNMRKGLFAFHMETGVGYKLIGKYFKEDEKCGLKEIAYLQVLDPWIGVRKNTPYKEMFKIGMYRIQESGLHNRENQLFYAKKPRCSGREGSFVSVSMVDCFPAILVLTYGISCSLGIFVLEWLAFKKDALVARAENLLVKSSPDKNSPKAGLD